MRVTKSFILLSAAAIAWATAVFGGVARVWTYEATAGVAAEAPITRPEVAGVERRRDLPELVVLVHPRCPCSHATIAELARVMTECQGKLAATVLMLRPAGMPEGWEQTGLWSSAAEIPGVTVRADANGEAARRFGAATSGQALLYAIDGRLLFNGGITASRGHEGDNAGRSTIASLVLKNADAVAAVPARTPVYGCPLFDGRTPNPMPPPANLSERSVSCPSN